MKRSLGVCAILALGVVAMPRPVSAGNIAFITTSCDRGVSIAWKADEGLATSDQQPPVDVWSMVIDDVRVNSEAVGFHHTSAVAAMVEPISAGGVVTIEVTLHWHAERPNGTTYDSPPLKRTGTVVCSASSAPGTVPAPIVGPPTDDGAGSPDSLPAGTISFAGDLPTSGWAAGSTLAIGVATLTVGLLCALIGRRHRLDSRLKITR